MTDPIVHLLDTLPAPQRIEFRKKSSWNSKPVEFIADFQNFNTDHGLAMSSIICSFKDKAGNLWFGTSGNGVSKYNGKSFTNFNSSHGLIHNLINCITDDSHGNIWFGTYGGASRFDGQSFDNYTTENGLPGNDIFTILEDSKGTIWLTSNKGLSRYIPATADSEPASFITYTSLDGITGNYSNVIYEDSNGNLWVAGSSGILKYQEGSDSTGESFVDCSLLTGVGDRTVYCITEDRVGRIWFGTNLGIVRYNAAETNAGGKAIDYFTTIEGLVDNRIRCSIIDRNGNLWFGTRGGISKYITDESSFLNFTSSQGLDDNIVNCITEDKSGSIWFGTLGSGLSKYNGSSTTGYSPEQGLPGNAIYAVTEDSENNLWFGTNDGGIVKCVLQKPGNRIESIETYSISGNNPDEAIFAILWDRKGNLWLGDNEGLVKYDGVTAIRFSEEQGLLNNYVISLTEDSKGNIWVGTYEGGISKFDGKSFTNYTIHQGLVHNTAWCILEDKAGLFWFATRGGLSIWNGTEFINLTKAQGMPDNKLSAVLEDSKGNIIIGSWGSGVFILRKETVEMLRNRNDGHIQLLIEKLSTTEGLSNDVVYSIKEDAIGNIFIGTNLGFTVLKGGLDALTTKTASARLENYNQKTGYPIRDVSNNNSMYIDNRGVVWAGTGDKLVRFDYSAVKRNADAPEIILEKIKIDNENISWKDLGKALSKKTQKVSGKVDVKPEVVEELLVFGKKLNETERETMISKFHKLQFDLPDKQSFIPNNLVLPHANNHISFDFTGIETARPSLVRYQYKLEGHDKSWSQPGSETTVSYTNLFNGNYTFLVKAQSPEGVWSLPEEYRFDVLPPWYRSVAAYILYALAFLGVVYIVDRYQRRRLTSRERQRTMKREIEQAKEIEKSYADLKTTQRLLIQAEKMASLGELTAGIAHEIQNPLNFVNNFSEVNVELINEMKAAIEKGDMHEVKAIADDIASNEKKIMQHGHRADAIVKGMLQHSRSGTGSMELTNLNAMTEEFVRLAYHGLRARDRSFNAGIKLDLDKTIGKINIIPQDIGRVILNMVTNAFYAVSDKKNAESSAPSASSIYEPLITVSTAKINNRVQLSIKDNGNGISGEVLNKIFQPFFTTKPAGQGTGLGLSLSYDIIKAHGGEIRVNTAEGEYAEFIIVFPDET